MYSEEGVILTASGVRAWYKFPFLEIWHRHGTSLAMKKFACHDFCSPWEGEVSMYSEEGVIRTASGIRAWYLTKFRGHRVRAVRVTPIPTILGRMAYSRRWVLVDQSHLPAA